MANTHGVAVAEIAGWPSKTMTRSARYVAIMKSCSITNAVFFAWRMNLGEAKELVKNHQTIKDCQVPFYNLTGNDTLLGIEETDKRTSAAVRYMVFRELTSSARQEGKRQRWAYL